MSDVSLKLDHIAVIARSLEEGAAHIHQQLGIEMPVGGVHPRMGTHNRLLSLGPDCFLEVIAVDPEAAAPNRPRWFDLDRFDASPALATWVVGSDDIHRALTRAHADSGRVIEMTRGRLQWLISVADDGRLPLQGAFPTLIQWPEGEHPAAKMVDLDCRLRRLTVEHPHAAEIEALIGSQLDRELIHIRPGDQRKLVAEIETPHGLKTLS